MNSEQCKFEKLRSVSIRNMNINDTPVEIASTVPSLRDIDLSENLLRSWVNLAAILGQVPLRILNVSLNLLPVPEVVPVEQFSHLVHLILGDMGYGWTELELLAGDLPQLEILQAHRNQVQEILVSDRKFLKLKELDLDCNKISDWEQVRNLDKIVNLENLRLNGNQISDLVLVPGQFKNLRVLQLSENLLENWSQISQLNHLNVTELRLRNNPVLLREKYEVCRQIIIALVQSIKILNGSTLVENERSWAELDYYKKHGLEYLKILKLPEPERTEALQSFSVQHGRYLEIVERLGVPEEAELTVRESNLKASLVSVKVRCPEVPGSADTGKKLPVSMTVAKLKALVGRLYRYKNKRTYYMKAF